MSGELQFTYGALPRTKRTTPVHLGGDPKGKNFLYCNGNTVFMRDIENPTICSTYTEHQAATTVARYSPSGFYIASADISGKVRVWDTVNETHILKTELHPFGGEVKDLCWDGESKRIMAVGAGASKYGAVMMWDSGSSLGVIDGHSKYINSCALRQSRPFRAVTAGEDNISNFYHGPPFKFNTRNQDHSRYVNSVRFSPNDMKYATCGSDMMAYIYDGKTGEKLSSLGEKKAHEGSVLSCSWVNDAQLLTASTDKTVKLWDVEANTAVSTFTFGSDVEHQQLGVLAQSGHMISVSLNGHINYLDKNDPTKPLRVLSGHNVSITSMAIVDEDNVFTGSYDGRIVGWASGHGTRFEGAGGHTNEVNAIALSNDNLVTSGKDDTVRSTPRADLAYTNTASVGLASCPHNLATGPGGVVVSANFNELQVLKDNKVVHTLATDWENLSVAVSPDGTQAAVGGKDNVLRIYDIKADALVHNKDIQSHKGGVFAVAYSPDGASIASGDSNRNVIVHDAKTLEKKIIGWCFHTARITSVAFSPDSTHVVSGGLDGTLFVWNCEQKTKRIKIDHAHLGGVAVVGFASNDVVYSAGADNAVRKWKITRHA